MIFHSIILVLMLSLYLRVINIFYYSISDFSPLTEMLIKNNIEYKLYINRVVIKSALTKVTIRKYKNYYKFKSNCKDFNYKIDITDYESLYNIISELNQLNC